MNSLYMLIRELYIIDQGFDMLVSISFKDPCGGDLYYITYERIW